MIRKIDHVAIAVGDLNVAIELFEKILGRKAARREYVTAQQVETVEFDLGGTAIELVEGTGGESPVRKFVERRGPGIHHIALEVDDIDRALADLEAEGMRPVDAAPRPGRSGSRVAFLHPESTSKILIELVQKKAEE